MKKMEHLKRKPKKESKKKHDKRSKKKQVYFYVAYLRFDFSTYKLWIIKTLLGGCSHHPSCFHFHFLYVALILETTRKHAPQ